MFAMKPICFLLVVVFGLRGVQTTLFNIFDRSYKKTTLRTYYENSPSEIKFTNSNIILFINDKGYDVGTYDNLHRPWGVDEPYGPSIEVNITDRYGSVVECERNRPVYFSSPRGTYAVHTGNSTRSIRCVADYNTNNTFIISSTAKDATKGKLYVLNTGQYTITYFWVTAQQIEEVGDRVTAVATDPINGDILIAEETESRERSFNLILLKKFRKDITTLSGFTEAVDKAEESIKELFKSDSKKRLDKLVSEISQIRTHIKTEQLPNSSSEINTNITCEDIQLQQLINTMRDTLIQLFHEIIIGDEKLEQKVQEIQCTNIMNKIRGKILDYSKMINSFYEGILPLSLESNVDITEATCLEIVKNKNEPFSCLPTKIMGYKQLKYHEYDKIVRYAVEFLTTNTFTELEAPTEIQVLGKNYELSEVKTYFDEAPSFIQYEEFLSSLIFLINDHSYEVGRDLSPMVSAPWFKPESHNFFTDETGNTVKCSYAEGIFSVQKKSNILHLPVFNNLNTSIVQCHVDYDKSRAFIIVSNSSGARKGKLFVFDTKHSILNNTTNAQEIREVGDSITAVTVRSLTGEIILTEKVIALNKNAFKVILLQPLLSKQKHEANKPYPKSIKEFTLVLKESEDRLIDQYDEGWRNCSNDLINQYYLLKSKIFPIKNEISNDSALHDSFSDPLREAITTTTNRITEIFNYNLATLDDRIAEERRERRVCQSVFNTFQTKMIRDIDYVFINYNSETDGTRTEPQPEVLSNTTCTKTLAGVHESLTCASTFELRNEGVYLRVNEQFLKTLRRMIIDLE